EEDSATQMPARSSAEGIAEPIEDEMDEGSSTEETQLAPDDVTVVDEAGGPGIRPWRGRRRRGRRRGQRDENASKPGASSEGSDQPQSTQPEAATDAASQAAAIPAPLASQPVERHAQPADYQPMMLPGESIAKYRGGPAASTASALPEVEMEQERSEHQHDQEDSAAGGVSGSIAARDSASPEAGNVTSPSGEHTFPAARDREQSYGR